MEECDDEVGFLDVNLKDLMLELNFAYQLLAIEVYSCDLAAHELLLRCFTAA